MRVTRHNPTPTQRRTALTPGATGSARVCGVAGPALALAKPVAPVRRRRPRRGFVIVVVTVVILLVTLAAYGFLSLMQVENQAARARGDQVQAEAVGFSGREYLAAVLEVPRSERPGGAEQDDATEAFGGILVDGDPDTRELAERQGRFAVLAPARRRDGCSHLALRIRERVGQVASGDVAGMGSPGAGSGTPRADESDRHG